MKWKLKKIKEINNRLTNQNRDLKSNYDITSNNIAKLKSQKETLEEKIANTNLMINNNQEESNRLRTLLVHNPEEFKKLIENLKSSLDDKRLQIATTDKRIQELQINKHKMLVLKEMINECIKSIQECQESFDEFKKFQKKAADENEKVEKVDSDVRNLEMENKQLIQNIQSMNDMIQRVKNRTEEVISSKDLKLHQLQENYVKLKDAFEAQMIELNEHQKFIQEIQNKNINLKEQIEKDKDIMNSAYNKLKMQVDCYLTEVQASLKENI